MSYPPANASSIASLGAEPTPDVMIIRCGSDDDASQTHFHARINDATRFKDLLREAAREAHEASRARSEGEPTVKPQDFLWKHVDPGLVHKSAPVRVVVQAHYVQKMYYSTNADAVSGFEPRLREWLQLATTVASGMHTLFKHGSEGWDAGIAFDDWWPFETYDRTAEDPLFKDCFKNAESDRLRTRVSLDEASQSIKDAWQAALDAHRRMLCLEAHHNLFVTDAFTVKDLAGLFLLTSLPDNWPKQPSLFDYNFWWMRVLHFGLERNVGLKMSTFNLDDAFPKMVSGLRRSNPVPTKTYCWLENALHTIVALKVMIFLRVRIQVYTAAGKLSNTAERDIQKRIRIDRHDVEQSKTHWLTPTRRSTTIPLQTPSRVRSDDQTKKRARCDKEDEITIVCCKPNACKKVKTDLQTVLLSLFEATQMRNARISISPQHAVTRQIIATRNRIRTRIDALDRIVATHEAWKRVCAAAPSLARAAEAVVRNGLRLDVRDGLWQGNSPLPVVQELLRIGAVSRKQPWHDHLLFRFDSVQQVSKAFGGDGSSGEFGCARRCSVAGGWARLEAESLAARLLVLLKEESEGGIGHELVEVPLECNKEYLPPATTQQSTQIVKKQIAAYNAARKVLLHRQRLFQTFVDITRKTMAHAIQSCFYIALNEVSRGVEGDGSSHLLVPERTQTETKTTAAAIVHRFLNIAAFYDALRTVSEGEDNDDGVVPILVYNRDSKTLLIPNPDSVIEQYWAAARLMISIATSAELWLRDHRRRPCASMLMEEDERWVTLSKDVGIVVHGTRRQQAASTRIQSDFEQISHKYWPRWPPQSHMMNSEPKIEKAIKWGRNAAYNALILINERKSKHVPKDNTHFPFPPFHKAATFSNPGAHSWLYKMHDDSMRAIETEVSVEDLFGVEDGDEDL